MRGVGALLVVFCHLACAFAPGLYWPHMSTTFGKIWYGTPLNVMTNGNVAVQLFFLLSGYMITANHYSNTTNDLGFYSSVLHRIKKTLKITVPAILLSFVLLRLGACFHLDVLRLGDRFSFFEDYCNFPPTLWSFLKDNILVLLKGSLYVGPLWTMHHDLIGFVCVFLTNHYAFLNKNERKRKWIYFLMGILFMHINANLVAFFVGAFVWELCQMLKSQNINVYVKNIIDSKIGRIFLIVLGVCCAGIPIGEYGGVFTLFGLFLDCIPEVAIRSFGLGVLLLVTIQTRSIQRILSISLLRFLGKYSAYIYAFHWQIILSVGCFICISMYDKVSYKLLVVLISVICIVLSVVCSVLYVKLYQTIKGKLVQRKGKNE